MKGIKTFWAVKYSRPLIRYQGKNLNSYWIRCCFLFFLRYLVQPKKLIRFLFHIMLIMRIRFWIFPTVNFYFVYFWNNAFNSVYNFIKFHFCYTQWVIFELTSRNTPFGSQGTEFWEPNIYIWVFFFESSI